MLEVLKDSQAIARFHDTGVLEPDALLWSPWNVGDREGGASVMDVVSCRRGNGLELPLPFYRFLLLVVHIKTRKRRRPT